MEEYIFMLMFIIPGFLSRFMVDSILDKDEFKSDFEKTVVSVLYGLPIWIMTTIIYSYIWKVYTIAEFKKLMGNNSFIIGYAISSLVCTLIFTVIIILSNKYIFKKINNRVRKTIGLPTVADEENAWKEFFGKKTNGRILAIEKDQVEIAKGMLKNNTTNNTKRTEIILEKCSLVKCLKENLEETEIYIDLEKNVVIREYILKEDEE